VQVPVVDPVTKEPVLDPETKTPVHAPREVKYVDTIPERNHQRARRPRGLLGPVMVSPYNGASCAIVDRGVPARPTKRSGRQR